MISVDSLPTTLDASIKAANERSYILGLKRFETLLTSYLELAESVVK